MKKAFIKILLPLTALLLTSCSFMDWIKTNIFNEPTNEQKDNQTTPEPEPEKKTYPGYPTKVETVSAIPLKVGNSRTIEVTYTPSTTTHKEVTWKSSDESVASVNNGEITAKKAGTAIVSANTINPSGEEIKSECKVVVADPSDISKTTLNYTYDDYMANNAYEMDNCPLVGESKLLVVPIWFNDSDTFIDVNYREGIRSDIEKSFFGTEEETGWHSVKSYYKEESKGILDMTGVVTDWYEISSSYVDYEPMNPGQSKTESLVISASDWYFSNSGEDRVDYDTNEDGYLDAVILIYAAPDSSNLPSASEDSNLWGYTSWLMRSPNFTNPTPNVFFWGSYDFLYSKGAYAHSKTNLASYGRGDTRYCKIDAHCWIHEMGHVLGLQDYYDYSSQHSPAGGFSMQDLNVGGHDPYSVMAYGWAKPIIPTKTSTIIIDDFQTSHDMILLADHAVDSPFDEYLLLELFKDNGLNEFDSKYAYREYYPTGPSKVGIRLWHVDARLTYWTGTKWTKNLITDPTHGNVYHAMSNTYYAEGVSGLSFLGSDYYDFNTLELIRKNGIKDTFGTTSLFFENESFSMSEYSSSFVKKGLLNSGKSLGWSFSVEAIDSNSAAIQVTKL